MKYAEILFFRMSTYCRLIWKSFLFFFITITSYYLKKLNKEKFFDLDRMSVERTFRRTQPRDLKFINKNGGFIKIGKIVDYHSSELSEQEYIDGLITTPSETPFVYPEYPHREIWRLMKNYFINIVMCEDQKNVLTYKKEDQYINADDIPYTITTAYLSLGPM